MKLFLIPACLSLLFAAIPYHVLAVDSVPSPNSGFSDGIDRTDPNFITASLLVMSPGNELYSCAGHSCIRLECPKFNLDYCFSYESEPVKDRVFTFLMGKLKMGMFALPTTEYLKIGKECHRSVMSYRLNLPPEVKQRLWKILDERVAQGISLPYDYVQRGCGRSVRVVLEEALFPLHMELPTSFPEKYKKTRRELWDDAVVGHPWNRFFLHSFCGTEHDWNVVDIEKIVVPSDLVEFLSMAKVNGKPIINEEGVELLPSGKAEATAFHRIFTPLVVAFFVVVASSVNWLFKSNRIDWLFLAFQSLAGVFFTYLVAFSHLPATDWNWLIVPFNLLPLVFWKWRKKWALYFAGVLALWEIGMITWPHRLTDPVYLVLVGAYIVMYARIGRDALVAFAKQGRMSPATV